ncbi:sensor histidine kinase [Acidovorax sp. DW039]|uniref:sensor histidine kinase N-terminal domain-containing protein n=1 Tax=Acidovorax sp. DW039 TaxID=3095606 RepID=UPI00308BC394|nr:sensor histidine kinase [Acidovorax sp. DW039]
MKAAGSRWLLRELLLRLMVPLLVIVAASGALGTYTSHRLTEKVFDRWLLDAARSLAHEVRFVEGNALIDLPWVAQTMLGYDEIDQVYYSVQQEGRQLLGRTDLPHRGTRETRYRAGRAFDAWHEGQPVRVAEVVVDDGNGAQATVLMAETKLKRLRAQREIFTMLLPLGLLLIAAAAAIGWAVWRTIRPLEAVATHWNAQSHTSLHPIGADDVPRELMPFATALNELLARIRAMLARERQFVATVAHQLRTPLAGIRLGLARAAEAPDLVSARRVLDELDHTAQRTSRLLQQLLALGRLDPEVRGDIDFVSVDLVALAHDVGSAYMELALDRQIDLELKAPEQPVMAVGQSDLLSEALGNLLDNALRYTPRGGRVVMEFETNPPSIRVSDSGPGVPDEEREAVFERLVRGSKTTGEGSGLGLAIVRDIAIIHDADVRLEASALGGTSVVLRFKQ